MAKQTVLPIGRAVFGAPQGCPVCGGRLAPMFGVNTDDKGIRRPYIDYTQVGCEDCRETFPVSESPEDDDARL